MTAEELLTEDISLKAEIYSEQMAYNERKHEARVRHHSNLNTEYARYYKECRELEKQHDEVINVYYSRRDEIALELHKIRAAKELAE
ncbi:MAG: hypothetical protein IJK84_10890 [Bacteroidales bacterium]|nr:hypothetical protein [Bacteroidales bacterium]MBQ7512640.1 hypothetical protein [Prevotella sp.]